METLRTDFLGQYKTISNKLKKRFLRKPNVAEASEQFSTLTKELQQQECPHYAAFCCLAVARCEHRLGNHVGETQALVQGARLFLDAEQQNHQLKCPSFNEHLNAAASCYNHAIKVHLEQKQPSLAAALALKVGHAFRSLGKTAEAIPYFQKAAELQNQCAIDYLNALDLVATCKLETGDCDGALNVLTEMYLIAEDKAMQSSGGKPLGVFLSILANAEVTRVLLLLLLQGVLPNLALPNISVISADGGSLQMEIQVPGGGENVLISLDSSLKPSLFFHCKFSYVRTNNKNIQPTPQRLQAEHAQILEKYAWEMSEGESSVVYLSEDLFLLLQSVVMAFQSRDIDSLKALQKDLWPLLTATQNTLLHEVIAQMSSSYI